MNTLWAIERMPFYIIRGLYNTLASVYDALLDIIDGTSEIRTFLKGASSTLYLLIGVFMLFRIGISLIQMLVDPDKINDKQEGGGKLVTKIVIVIVLLLSLDSYIFPLLEELEGVIVRNITGIVEKIFTVDNSTVVSGGGSTTHTTNGHEFGGGEGASFSSNANSLFQLNNMNDKFILDVYAQCTCPSGYSGPDNNNKCYTKKTYSVYKRNGKKYCMQGTLINGECVSNVVEDANCSSPDSSTENSDTCQCPEGWSASGNNCSKTVYYTRTGGLCNSSDTGCTASSVTMKCDAIVNPDAVPDPPSNTNTNIGNNGENTSTTEGKKFARSVFSVSLDEANDEEYSAKGDIFKYDGQFLSESDKDDIKKLADSFEDDDWDFSFIIALIIGLAIMVFVIVLMIDIVVRTLKLILLEVISPIPVMSYLNPKDKIFMEWVKMYASTYAELFLKLLGIQLVIKLIPILANSSILEGRPFIKLIYYFGVFLFAKAVPDLISKLFGIKAGSGTLKQAAGLAKAGLGFGVGAAAGAIGAGSVFARGGTAGEAFGVAGQYMKGGSKFDFSAGKKAKQEGIKTGTERKAMGQTRRNAQKNAIKGRIPFMKTDQEVAQEKIAKLENEKAGYSHQVSNFEAADKLLEKDKPVMDATNLLNQYNTTGAFNDSIMSDDSNMMIADGFKLDSDGNKWVKTWKDSDGTEHSSTIANTVSAMKTHIDSSMTSPDGTRTLSGTQKITFLKAQVEEAKNRALDDPNSAVGKRARTILEFNGPVAQGTGYSDADKSVKATRNKIKNIDEKI